jgi:hypothetical protein
LREFPYVLGIWRDTLRGNLCDKGSRRANQLASRALAVNNNTAPATTEQIRQRAYELYVESGYQPGKEVEHWLRAEAELNQTPQVELPKTA